MRHRACRRRAAAGSALALAVLAASCMLPPRPDPTRFYVLAASAPDHPPAPGSLVLGLGPITMPGYLQRPMLAIRADAAQVRYADFDRWAEPLPTLFGRALGADLCGLLDARIVPYPWYRVTPLDVVVRVDVTAFEADAAGKARLEACWSIRDSRTRIARREECSAIVEAIEGHGAQAQVAALGRAVSELARRVAKAIRS